MVTVEEKIISLYVNSGYSARMIEEETGFGRYIVSKTLKKAGVMRSRKDAVILAESKGRMSHADNPGMHTEEAKRKGIAKRYQNGIKGYSCHKGYIALNSGKYEHVAIIEKMIGRRLLPGELVHHKNQVRSDNRPENLLLMRTEDHTFLHHYLRSGLTREAVIDILESGERPKVLCERYGLERHRVNRMRKIKEKYYSLFKLLELCQ